MRLGCCRTPFPLGRYRRAFTFLEVAVTLLVLSIVVSLTVVVFSTVRSTTSGVGTAALISAAHLEARRLLDDGTFPASTVTTLSSLSSSELTLITGEASSGEVSIYRASDSEMAFVSPSGPRCLVLVDRLTGSATWAAVDTGALCSASAMHPIAAALPPGGTPSNPQVVSDGL